MEFTEEKTDYTTSDALEKFIAEYGVSPCLRGCRYLARAVQLYSVQSFPIKNIYRDIAKEYSTADKSVKRDIAYAISHAKGLREKLSAEFATEITANEIRNNLVIAYLNLLWKNKKK